MNRHPLDLYSLITGLLFVTLGVLFMLDQQDVLHVDARWVPASVLLALGTAGIASSLRSDTTTKSVADRTPTLPDDSVHDG